MESTVEIEWFFDARERLIELAKGRENWGDYEGISSLGKRLLQEVTEKILEVSRNLNLYNERDDEERVATLDCGFVLIYKKVYYKNAEDITVVKLLIINVRKSY